VTLWRVSKNLSLSSSSLRKREILLRNDLGDLNITSKNTPDRPLLFGSVSCEEYTLNYCNFILLFWEG